LKWHHIPKLKLGQDEEVIGRKSAYFFPEILPKHVVTYLLLNIRQQQVELNA
jgi:hypothetical protein